MKAVKLRLVSGVKRAVPKKKATVVLPVKKSTGIELLRNAAEQNEAVTIWLDPQMLEKIDAYCKIDECSREAFVTGAVIGHITDRVIEDNVE